MNSESIPIAENTVGYEGDQLQLQRQFGLYVLPDSESSIPSLQNVRIDALDRKYHSAHRRC